MSDFEHIRKEDADDFEDEEMATQSDFALVIFHNVLETYPIDANIECNYTVTRRLYGKPSDWVGLYRVGWGNCREYVMFEWSKLPQDYKQGSDVNASVMFNSQKLPKDDGEFYQFCYVTESNQVRGASTPFQFKRPCAGDFIALDDRESDLVVIECRRAALEKDLRQAARENEQLLREKQQLEEERETLLERLVKTESQCKQQQQNIQAMKNDVKSQREEITEMTAELEELRLIHSSVVEKIEQARLDKEAIEKRLTDNEVYVGKLQNTVAQLKNEKDTQAGLNRSLQEEKELIKEQWSSTEQRMRVYMEQAESLQGQVDKHKQDCHQSAEQVVQLKIALEEQSQTLLRQQDEAKQSRGRLGSLTEQIQNAEDRLDATAHSKQLLCAELATIQDTCTKLTEDLQTSEVTMENLKVNTLQAEEEFRQTITTLEKENSLLEASLQATESQVQELKAQKDGQQTSALSVLQMAQTDLKRQFSSIKTQRDSLKKDLDHLFSQKGVVDSEVVDLRRETEDLRERLRMGQEEWQVKYIECRRLQLELKKANRAAQKAGSGSPSCSSASGSAVNTECQTSVALQDAEEAHGAQRVMVEAQTNTSMPQRGEGASGGEAASGYMIDDEDVPDLTSSELTAQLAELATELEQRTARKLRYKARYQQEREKNALLQRHYFEELAKRDEARTEMEREMLNIQKQAEQAKDTLLYRIHLLEKSATSVTPTRETPPPIPKRPSLETPTDVPTLEPVREQPVAAATVRDEVDDVESPRLSQKEVEKLAEELDIKLPSENAHPLDTIILPPPIQPYIMQSARLAELKAACGVSAPHGFETADILEPVAPPFSSLEPLEEVVTDGLKPTAQPTAPPTEVDEEKYEDALCEPPKHCPICELLFAIDTSDAVITDHIDAHFGPECPICKERFDVGFPTDQLQAHVNNHF